MSTSVCRHNSLGMRATGTVCNECGATWAQMLRDYPGLQNPYKHLPNATKSAVDDVDYVARRLKEIEEERFL
jgi:hypothetical protein